MSLFDITWHLFTSLAQNFFAKICHFFSRQNQRPNTIGWPRRLCFIRRGRNVNLYCPFMWEVPVYLMNQTQLKCYIIIFISIEYCVFVFLRLFYRLEISRLFSLFLTQSCLRCICWKLNTLWHLKHYYTLNVHAKVDHNQIVKNTAPKEYLIIPEL